MEKTILTDKPITEIIAQRRSCRTYQTQPIATDQQIKMKAFLAANQVGPLGNALQTGVKARFELIAAVPEDRSALRGLGTYGTIKGVNAFILGAIVPGEKDMEDYGYLMEKAILYATAIELETCWIGGFFTRSSFARRMRLGKKERMPAVAAIGYSAGSSVVDGVMRNKANSNNRFPWEMIFFVERFGQAMLPENAGQYAAPLEMVRLAPSASNKQPWRILRQGASWHFYLQRTPGYGRGLVVRRFLEGNDLQRVDMGIAMCHWELTAREAGLPGAWQVKDPGIPLPGQLIEYCFSWVQRDEGK